jgi:hypothetical protein
MIRDILLCIGLALTCILMAVGMSNAVVVIFERWMAGYF